MKTVELEQAAGSLADYVEQAGNEPLVLTRNGQPYAAIVLYDMLEALHNQSTNQDIANAQEGEKLLDYLARVRTKRKAGRGTRSLDEVRERLGLA